MGRGQQLAPHGYRIQELLILNYAFFLLTMNDRGEEGIDKVIQKALIKL